MGVIFVNSILSSHKNRYAMVRNWFNMLWLLDDKIDDTIYRKSTLLHVRRRERSLYPLTFLCSVGSTQIAIAILLWLHSIVHRIQFHSIGPRISAHTHTLHTSGSIQRRQQTAKDQKRTQQIGHSKWSIVSFCLCFCVSFCTIASVHRFMNGRAVEF